MATHTFDEVCRVIRLFLESHDQWVDDTYIELF